MKYLLLPFFILLTGCYSDCGYIEEKKYAESLSQDQLFGLYTEVSNLAKDVKGFEPMRAKSEIHKSNIRLTELGFKFLEIESNYARIILGGCFDDKASLLFEGFKENKKSIVLVSGEHSYFERKILLEKSI